MVLVLCAGRQRAAEVQKNKKEKRGKKTMRLVRTWWALEKAEFGYGVAPIVAQQSQKSLHKDRMFCYLETGFYYSS
jgi:hypothetical protein